MSLVLHLPARIAVLSVALLATLTACGGEALRPEAAVAGDYVATTMLVREGASVVDALAAGTEIVLRLRADGTTSGRFYVPGDESAAGVDAELDGTWWLVDGEVRVWHSADTLLRHRKMRVQGGRLHLSTDDLQLVLSRR